jgi:hypothetical protein
MPPDVVAALRTLQQSGILASLGGPSAMPAVASPNTVDSDTSLANAGIVEEKGKRKRLASPIVYDVGLDDPLASPPPKRSTTTRRRGKRDT